MLAPSGATPDYNVVHSADSIGYKVKRFVFILLDWPDGARPASNRMDRPLEVP